MRFRAKNGAIRAGINRTTESQSDCKDNHWFQNGFNKCSNQAADSQSRSKILLQF